MIVAAESSPQAIPLALIKPVTATGIVCAFGEKVRFNANKNSFHDNKNVNIAVATMPGADSGTRL